MNSNIKYIQASADEFSPKVLRISYFTGDKNFPKGYKFEKRVTADYEIEFFTYSEGSLMIEDKVYTIHEGDISFRRPGELVQGILPYNCYLLCFDLLGNTGKSFDFYDFLDISKLQPNYLNPIIETIPSVFHPSLPETYRSIFDNMLKEFINPTEASTIALKSQTLELLHKMYKDANNPLNSSIPSSAYYSQLKHAIGFLEENYNKKILLKDVAAAINLSPNYFHKVFTDTLKITPNQYLTKLRLDKARELLVKTNIAVAKVALECGFENTPYFSYIFKSSYNISPVDFRRKYSEIGK